jgi:hypothetical protein
MQTAHRRLVPEHSRWASSGFRAQSRDEPAERPRETVRQAHRPEQSRRTGARSREAGPCPNWEFRSGCAPFVGIFQGGWPPWRSRRGRLQSRAYDGREAYVNQYVDQPSGEPARPSRSVVTALARSSALCMILARRKNTAMSSDFRIGGAVEVFANEAPRSSLLRRSSHFDYEGLKLRGILRNSSKPLPSFAKATEGSPRRRIMRARQRPNASAAESNWILQEVKMIQLRSCWSSCSAFVFPFDIVTTRCF